MKWCIVKQALGIGWYIMKTKLFCHLPFWSILFKCILPLLDNPLQSLSKVPNSPLKYFWYPMVVSTILQPFFPPASGACVFSTFCEWYTKCITTAFVPYVSSSFIHSLLIHKLPSIVWMLFNNLLNSYTNVFLSDSWQLPVLLLTTTINDDEHNEDRFHYCLLLFLFYSSI